MEMTTASYNLVRLAKLTSVAVQVIAHNLTRWTGRIGLVEPLATTKTLRRRFFSLLGRIPRKARRLTLTFPRAGPGKTSSAAALARLRALSLPS